MKKLGVYIHIPFCVKKCFYCDFLSFEGSRDLYQSYYNALKSEIKAVFSNTAECLTRSATLDLYEKFEIDSIFIGGGTPTVFPPDFICGIIDSLPEKNISSCVEITIEANPGTVDYNYLKAIMACGVNRISFGLQSCDDLQLKSLGRIHNYQSFEENYNQAFKLGYTNINLDLMFSLPGQSLEDWQRTLDTALYLAPASVSAYALTIEENTPFGKAEKEGKLRLPNDILDREMYYAAKSKLTEQKYRHVEISYFAKKGHECRHNLKYWNRQEYLGFGLNSHSFIGKVRYRNTSSLKTYIYANGSHEKIRRDKTSIDRIEAISEHMFLGLRLISGVNKNVFNTCFGLDVYDVYKEQIEKLKHQGLIADNGEAVFLTDKGLDLANIAMSEFIL